MEERPHDIIVYAATGTYGSLTAEYLLNASPPGTRIAIASRDVDKARTVCSRIQAAVGLDASASPLQVVDFPVDAHHPRALRRMAASTWVVANSITANAQHLVEAVAAACVASGTHYCDLVPFQATLERLAARFDASCKARGLRLVPACGFDFALPDVALLEAARAFRAAFKAEPAAVEKVLAVQNGPLGVVIRLKVLDNFLTPHGARDAAAAAADPAPPSPPRDGSSASAAGSSPHAASAASAAGGADPPGAAGVGPATPDWYSGRQRLDGVPDAAGLTATAEQQRPVPWLAYSPELRCWSVPFPAAAAERYLLARRQQQEPGDAPVPHLDCRMKLPQPSLPWRYSLLLAAAAPALLWLLLFVLLPLLLAAGLAARRWARARAWLLWLLPLLTAGHLTGDEAKARRAMQQSRFTLLLVASGADAPPAGPLSNGQQELAKLQGPRRPSDVTGSADRCDEALTPGTPLPLTAPPAAAAGWVRRAGRELLRTACWAASHAAAAARTAVGGRAPKPRAARCQVQLWVSGPLLNTTPACLALASLELLRATKADAAAAARQGGCGGPRAARSGVGVGVLTPAQLLAGGRFWQRLQQEFGMVVSVVARDAWVGCADSAQY